MPDIDDPFLEEFEPVATQQGIDVPGSRSGFTDFINFGVYNGNFRVGPPQAASNIDVASSLAGSNFLPGWRFVQSSNTTITAAILRSGGVGSGSNIRFAAQAGVANGDASFIEQIVDIGGSSVGDIGNLVRVTGQTNGAMNGLVVYVATQYLASDGSVLGMPPERVQQGSVGATIVSTDVAADVDPPPANARYLRLRAIAQAVTGTAAGDWLDLRDIRRDRAIVNLRMPDISRSTNGLYDVRTVGSNLYWQPSAVTSGSLTSVGNRRLLNQQLVAIPFTLNSIPSSATTDLQPFDNAVAQGTPRISVGWAGSIVGLSYRMTGIPTAGGATALVIWATVAGAQTWKAFTIPGTGGAAADQNTLAPEVATFTSSQGVGIQVVTSGTYAPTTRNISAILWVAVKYDGA